MASKVSNFKKSHTYIPFEANISLAEVQSDVNESDLEKVDESRDAHGISCYFPSTYATGRFMTSS